MIVGYRLQPLSYALARLLVRVPHVALVNLIAGHRAAPELIQGRWQAETLADGTRTILTDGADEQRSALAQVRDRLGSPGASRRAAEAVGEYLPTHHDSTRQPVPGSED
jgi:lipid-A-disaccharide synthase